MQKRIKHLTFPVSKNVVTNYTFSDFSQISSNGYKWNEKFKLHLETFFLYVHNSVSALFQDNLKWREGSYILFVRFRYFEVSYKFNFS